jgi:hypothetical protein
MISTEVSSLAAHNNREFVDCFDFVFTRYLGITKNHMKIMGQHLVIFSIENPYIYFDFDFPHHLGITKIHMKTMGQHPVNISRSAALHDTQNSEEDSGVSEYLSEYILLCQSACFRCYQYTALWARSATGIEVCNRSAHCGGINGCQPHNLSTLLLFAAPTRSAHGRAGAKGSVRHKNFAKARRYISSVDRLLYCFVWEQNFP